MQDLTYKSVKCLHICYFIHFAKRLKLRKIGFFRKKLGLNWD